MNLFITGTGTDVGKTYITGLLAQEFQKPSHSIITQKWIQTGCTSAEDLAIHDQFIGPQDPQLLPLRCPYLFPEPFSPHLVAQIHQKPIDPEHIKQCYITLSKQFDSVIIEGAGGALVPYAPNRFMIDIAIKLNLPIAIVTVNQVGALHATFSTIDALLNRNATIWGTILNQISPEVDPRVIKDNRDQIHGYRGIPVQKTVPPKDSF
jgi:dethiobiotin synthetase